MNLILRILILNILLQFTQTQLKLIIVYICTYRIKRYIIFGITLDQNMPLTMNFIASYSKSFVLDKQRDFLKFFHIYQISLNFVVIKPSEIYLYLLILWYLNRVKYIIKHIYPKYYIYNKSIDWVGGNGK